MKEENEMRHTKKGQVRRKAEREKVVLAKEQ
jgi:WD repeat and SOF domain-containing protein 1